MRCDGWKQIALGLWVAALGLGLVAGPDVSWAAEPGPSPRGRTEVEEVFRRAAAVYDRGDFERAAELYNDLLRAGFTSGEVYYNLGNAYYRMGAPGYALLNYRRAELLLPRDRDVRENLRLTRARREDRFAEPGWQSLARTLAFWNELLNDRELFVAFLVAQGLLGCLLGARRFARPLPLRVLVWVFLGGTIVLGASLAVRTGIGYRAPEAVVVQAEVPVTSGPAASETVMSQIHEGAEVRMLSADPPFLRIRLPDGNEGWVPESRIERVVPTTANDRGAG